MGEIIELLEKLTEEYQEIYEYSNQREIKSNKYKIST